MIHRPPLFRTPTLDCRPISPDDASALKSAAELDTARWGQMGQDVSTFGKRAANGFVVGAWHWSGLVGTISCLRRSWSPVETGGDWTDAHPYATWDSTCGNGTFETAEPDGDALFCMAVTTMDSGPRPWPALPKGPGGRAVELARILAEYGDASGSDDAGVLRDLASACAGVYIPTDYVMRFHGRPKGGILSGARIVRILPQGRPSDLDAMGYNVLMAYPHADSPGTLEAFPASIDMDVSSGEALVLAAARLASDLKMLVVVPYSRPAGFRYSLVRALIAAATGNADAGKPLHGAVMEFFGRSNSNLGS